MTKSKVTILGVLLALAASAAWSQQKQPLVLKQTVQLPELKDGDFDHFTVDLEGKRLFSAAEENSRVLVFDLETGKLIKSLNGLKAPHSMAYRGDLKKLFVVDSDIPAVRMYDTVTYKVLGDIKMREGADSSVYDPVTKYLYVISGGRDGHMPNSYLTVVDTTSTKQLADVKLDSDDVEAVRLETSGSRLFVVIRGNNAVEVFDRKQETPNLLATWHLAKDADKPTAMAYDEAGHRLFIGTRNPGKLIIVDSTSGKVVADVPAASMVDDMAYGAKSKRIYFAGTEFLDVFQQGAGNRYELVGHIPTGFRAKTGILVPELNRYYLGVPHHEGMSAELLIYQLLQ